MDIFCCRLNNLISFFLVIYFILMVVGPSSSNSVKICERTIHEVFKINENQRRNKKTYFHFAIINLRYLKPEERAGYFLNMGIEEPQQPRNWAAAGPWHVGTSSQFQVAAAGPSHFGTSSQFQVKLEEDAENLENVEIEPPQTFYLLWYGFNTETGGHIINEEYSYKYYEAIAGLFEPNNILSPSEYCDQYQAGLQRNNCQYALQYFGFVVDTVIGAIRHAFFGLVYVDITSQNTFRRDMVEPADKSFASMYLMEIGKRVRTIEYHMIRPLKFCEDYFKE